MSYEDQEKSQLKQLEASLNRLVTIIKRVAATQGTKDTPLSSELRARLETEHDKMRTIIGRSLAALDVPDLVATLGDVTEHWTSAVEAELADCTIAELNQVGNFFDAFRQIFAEVTARKLKVESLLKNLNT